MIVRTIVDLRREIAVYRRKHPDGSVGFVPTMGYLHEGHASLIRRSAADNGLTVLSIFVNPIQFGPHEDLDKYPRDEARDMRIAAASGANIAFLPNVKEMYPAERVTTVSVTGITDRLCGASRPGHFDGVATVVAKLFNIVQPDRAYFGLKDAQQVAVIDKMTRDLNLPVEIVPCPIVREPDGLALSSRNVYLSDEERAQALVLSQTLEQAAGWIIEGATTSEIADRLKDTISTVPSAKLEYAEIVAYPNLSPLEPLIPLRDIDETVIIALAARFGTTRLIDNWLFNPKKAGESLCFVK